MTKIASINFLLEETGEDVDLTMLSALVTSMYGSAYKEDFDDFTKHLVNYSNNNPITVDYLVKALDRFVVSVPFGFGLENIFNFIALFSHIDDSPKATGNFLKYVFTKHQSIEDIKNANINDIGVFYKARFERLQKFLNENK